MTALRATLMGLGIAAALAAMPGCGGGSTGSVQTNPPANPLAGLDALLQTWNDDLTDEDVPVARQDVEPTLLTDEELRRALFTTEEPEFATGAGE